MGSATSPKRVLLLTNSEHGQANVFLATSYGLLTLEDEDVEVHFASFPPIKSLVSTTSNHAQADKPGARPIVFHAIEGIDMVSAWSRPEIVAEQNALKDQSIFWLINAIRRTLVLLKVTLPWTGPEFVQIMHSITAIIQDTQPNMIAVDPAFSPALTVLRQTKAKFIVLTPNTIKDFAMPAQPNAEALWKYPCLGTTYPYPIPLLSIPHNTLLILLSLLVSLFDPHRRALTTYLAHHYHSTPGSVNATTTKLTTLSDLALHAAKLNTKFLVANLPEMELPLRIIPRHVVPCGPMLRPARPLGEVDADLQRWLLASPGGGSSKTVVVYINLGTHVVFDGGMVGEMAGAVRVLLDAAARAAAYDDAKDGGGGGAHHKGGSAVIVERVLGEEVRKGVVKVVEWLEAEPTAVLAAGTVVCAVHHGGANSFLESVSAGVPQVVLPLWMDTYDFARRAELLGIGRWGNLIADRLCEANEFGSRRLTYAQKARELAELCKRSGGGRVIAARHVLAEIDDGNDQLSTIGQKESDLLLDSNGNGHC
ncbi:hypothetical protein C8A00DRAFT_47293 [Chaetomidium leptoderma]|uniref:Uncharacterized protein n=1 Tax=Chaetomidium leptoderma TaxID=669021 RepID=A0AAN6ZU36_9PEZI|nr:hypothetical protein C8A00DRAFT_47293 [Chaetomidium leptoderma]